MKKTLSIPYQIMLIIVAVLAVYYPTQFGEISLVDDLGAISAFFSPEHISFADLFIPRSAGGGYYRPLIGVSLWLDKQLWFLDEHLLHFEGVLAHLLNGLLVYFVCREAVCLYLKEKQTYLPLVSALLFSLHPINTESVNWISGRTDVMMATFVLLSMYCLLRYLQNRSKLLLFFVFFFAVIALLAKETAFGYLVGLTLLVTLQPDEQIAKHEDDITKRKINIYIFITYYVCASLSALFLGSYWLVLLICFFYCMHIACKRCSGINCIHSCYQTFKPFVTLMVTLAGSIVLAVFLRKIAFTSSVGKIGQTVTLMLGDLNYTLSLFLGSAGFYVKKFFIPVPLSFYIREIDPLYDFVGIAVLLVTINLLFKRTLPAIMALIGLFLVLPALPLAFGTIAWTAYAERYIYLSSALWSISICLLLGKYLQRDSRLVSAVTVIMILLCTLSAAVTHARNRVWMTNVDLMRDTVLKSPNNRKVRDIYIDALLRAGQVDEAKQQYRYANETLPAPHYDDIADVLIGNQLVKEKNYAEALNHYEKALQRTNYSSEALLSGTVQLLRVMKISNDTSKQEYYRLDKLEQGYAKRLYSMTRNPRLLIEAGTSALQRGSLDEANSYYDAALQKMPQNDRLVPLVRRLKDKVRGN